MLSKRRPRGSRAPACGQQGFSLLEVVLTIALLTTTTLGTSLLLVPIARQSRIGRETQIANSAARGVLERLQATPFKDLLTDYPPSSVKTISELPSGKVTVQYEDPAADPLIIEAIVTWDSPDLGSMSRAFNTIRTE